MKTLVVLATSFLATTSAFAAGSGYQFTGTQLAPKVQAKIASSAERAVKRYVDGSLSGGTITMSRGTNAFQAKLTGTSNANAVELDAQFKISTSKKGNLSVQGVRTRSRAHIGQEVTSPVWNLVADGPK